VKESAGTTPQLSKPLPAIKEIHGNHRTKPGELNINQLLPSVFSVFAVGESSDCSNSVKVSTLVVDEFKEPSFTSLSKETKTMMQQ